MDTLESELTQEELGRVEKFYRKLKQPDLDHVRRVVNSVDNVANQYFSSGEQNSNYWAFCNGEKVGTPFFAAYLVGGYLNKEGERPDIDLLVATNMRWNNGFIEDYERLEEPIWGGLKKAFSEDAEIVKNGDLPNDYNIGATKGKVLITINPTEGKKLDVSYVRSWQERGFQFIDEEQFSKLDVGNGGEPLSRLPLYRTTSSVQVPQMRL